MNRVNKIKAFRERENNKKLAEIEQKEREHNELLQQIQKLTPRIEELIDVARACLENNIEINKYRKTHLSKYDHYEEGTFVTNGISHRVGFVLERMQGKPLITHMGIQNGGYNGKLDFFTNGIETYSVHEDSHEEGIPQNSDMKKFLKTFDYFESAFYKYVDDIIE